MGRVLASNGAEALDVEEASKRAPSMRLLALVVLGTLTATGAVFTAGSKWGGSTSNDAAAIASMREGLASNVVAIRSLSDRIAVVEVTKTTLVPAVDRLSVQTDKLAEAVTALRVTLAEQNVEIRNLNAAVSELRAKPK